MVHFRVSISEQGMRATERLAVRSVKAARAAAVDEETKKLRKQEEISSKEKLPLVRLSMSSGRPCASMRCRRRVPKRTRECRTSSS
jgi:hypothetical protein